VQRRSERHDDIPVTSQAGSSSAASASVVSASATAASSDDPVRFLSVLLTNCANTFTKYLLPLIGG